MAIVMDHIDQKILINSSKALDYTVTRPTPTSVQNLHDSDYSYNSTTHIWTVNIPFKNESWFPARLYLEFRQAGSVVASIVYDFCFTECRYYPSTKTNNISDVTPLSWKNFEVSTGHSPAVAYGTFTYTKPTGADTALYIRGLRWMLKFSDSTIPPTALLYDNSSGALIGSSGGNQLYIASMPRAAAFQPGAGNKLTIQSPSDYAVILAKAGDVGSFTDLSSSGPIHRRGGVTVDNLRSDCALTASSSLNGNAIVLPLYTCFWGDYPSSHSHKQLLKSGNNLLATNKKIIAQTAPHPSGTTTVDFDQPEGYTDLYFLPLFTQTEFAGSTLTGCHYYAPDDEPWYVTSGRFRFKPGQISVLGGHTLKLTTLCGIWTNVPGQWGLSSHGSGDDAYWSRD